MYQGDHEPPQGAYVGHRRSQQYQARLLDRMLRLCPRATAIHNDRARCGARRSSLVRRTTGKAMRRRALWSPSLRCRTQSSIIRWISWRTCCRTLIEGFLLGICGERARTSSPSGNTSKTRRMARCDATDIDAYTLDLVDCGGLPTTLYVLARAASCTEYDLANFAIRDMVRRMKLHYAIVYLYPSYFVHVHFSLLEQTNTDAHIAGMHYSQNGASSCRRSRLESSGAPCRRLAEDSVH